MPKPQWLKDIERGVKKIKREPDYCRDCIYLGRPVKQVKYKGPPYDVVYECDIHPKCFNTKSSICCDDFTR